MSALWPWSAAPKPARNDEFFSGEFQSELLWTRSLSDLSLSRNYLKVIPI